MAYMTIYLIFTYVFMLKLSTFTYLSINIKILEKIQFKKVSR